MNCYRVAGRKIQSSLPGWGNSTSLLRSPIARPFAYHQRLYDQKPHPQDGASKELESNGDGAMSRRLAEMTEEAITQGGSSTRKNIQQETGFSEELKQRLQERIAETAFKNENAAAISYANLPQSAGKGTRDIAGAPPWTGNESIHDATLRMLTDASNPMRVPFRPPQPGGPVPTAPKPKRSVSSGERLAAARERTTEYTLKQDSSISKEERESFRKELQDRFGPAVHSFPVTIQGLSSLANERIEDAMARGQFNNIPRGKGKYTKRDPTADSPYIDTTEFVMNQILQKEDTTPEWIQKQHSMQSEVKQFRNQLRENWRNHAVLMIRSKGGTLEEQIRRARSYAAAESKHNKLFQDRVRLSGSDDNANTASTGTSEILEDLPCLRDPQYMSTEREYHELKIKRLNESIRSYNLQAPQVSQRPYFNLQRELDSCYADVAISLPDEIRERATRGSTKPGSSGSHQTGLGGFSSFSASAHESRIYDEDSSKGYGFKQMWRDLWN
ncbi:hypothetical protein H112_03457 [Trichophyton rubrum D6]|uniref:DnaJ homologue subfamily C member 28 conserved domain-containing protein n=4 Tax=Trichophyton TaxID=5550 RepID=A0A178EXI5_TRIRU|nr:uncharacterized protein TERG_04783 [Trichophyton rubrum CBS 118892]EZF23983.1 hypothetical protein H100_03462 [Trichophyton rubrum MR850]EZF42989.1 hypothetical protein H102_03457 [Trichophyton rubrum CBS 100081]EZF53679.1 hypothetical protein H103_03466 [Trichophyton rubrum CBS 288.86]EZF64256.1 hypothetical protein H104_03451 [Trichophyton rubrum CBS 289.86]EZF74794.1 hypothetical protein H105_03478 [Trichophyton soudanense CBS 452.61]EZF85552.1 hypothetical protein H110_03463 [Trichophy